MLHFIQSRKAELHKCKTYDEATTKQAIILPILQKLGWDIFNCEEVCPEYGVSGKRVDYALRTGGKNFYFIEVKKCSIDLEAHQEQLLLYAFREGVGLACLNNGITWQFFLPLKEGSWKSRLFYTVNFENKNSEEVITVLSKVLSKAAVVTKEALQWSKELHQDKERDEAIKSSLPKVLNILLREPTTLFIEAVTDKTEKICGYRPTVEQVRSFIFSHDHRILSMTASDAQPPTVNFFSSPAHSRKSCVNIRETLIITEREGSESENYFSTILPILLPLLPPRELNNLQNIKYCNSELGLGKQYPLLSKNKTEMVETTTGKLRAWKNPIAGFWVSAQWNKKNLLKWTLYLKRLERELNPPVRS